MAAHDTPSMQATILWHDYETFGVNPKHDAPCQFAAVRTDMDLNVIGKPINIFCQIPNDYLPQPRAVMVTGITPQQSLRDGYIEAEFCQKVRAAMMQAQTCVAGYNSIRFDDEVTRHLLYRNFYDAYEREWKDGNSRWDIIDLMRACYALRPEGIEWPLKENGTPSFKLEELSKANGIEHMSAHDAVSDVLATIAVAKLIKEKQPKLFDYYFGLRKKQAVQALIDVAKRSPFVHVSGMISAQHGCCSWYMPVCYHPSNKNAVICIDLAADISAFETLNAEQLRALLYTKSDELPEGQTRPPIKLVHLNKSPFVASAKTLSPEIAERLGIDRENCLSNLQTLKQHQNLTALLQGVYTLDDSHDDSSNRIDIDAALYTRGFASPADKEWMRAIVKAEPEQLASWADKAPNAEYATQLFRYRARNYPNTLSEQEINKWQQHRRHRFVDGGFKGSLNMQQYQEQILELVEEYANVPEKLKLLSALEKYAHEI